MQLHYWPEFLRLSRRLGKGTIRGRALRLASWSSSVCASSAAAALLALSLGRVALRVSRGRGAHGRSLACLRRRVDAALRVRSGGEGSDHSVSVGVRVACDVEAVARALLADAARPPSVGRDTCVRRGGARWRGVHTSTARTRLVRGTSKFGSSRSSTVRRSPSRSRSRMLCRRALPLSWRR